MEGDLVGRRILVSTMRREAQFNSPRAHGHSDSHKSLRAACSCGSASNCNMICVCLYSTINHLKQSSEIDRR